MLPPALPPVDPDALLVERDPEVLDSYARGLLSACSADLRRRLNLPAPPGDYPITAAACWLIDAYADAGVPLSPSAALLVRQLLSPQSSASTSPVRAKSRDAFWAAIEFEADTGRKEPDQKITVYRVAQHLVGLGFYEGQGAAENAVTRWRALPEYQSNVEFQRDGS